MYLSYLRDLSLNSDSLLGDETQGNFLDRLCHSPSNLLPLKKHINDDKASLF